MFLTNLGLSPIWLILIIPCVLVFLVLIGYIDDKLGIFTKENELHNDRVPQINELLKK